MVKRLTFNQFMRGSIPAFPIITARCILFDLWWFNIIFNRNVKYFLVFLRFSIEKKNKVNII